MDLRRAIDFYIGSSLHVALAVWALVRMTEHMFGIAPQTELEIFAFCGTVIGYNFVKYDALSRTGKRVLSMRLKTIIALSFISFLIGTWCFLQLRLVTQLACIGVLLITVLYTLPFFPNRKNARNWAGVKIYIVALCWTGVTVVLPILNSGIGITQDFYLKCTQRFILVFVLVLIFEIIDLAKDDPHLKTVPQQIGVKRTKIIGIALLLIFYFLEFLRFDIDPLQLIANGILIAVTAVLLVFANPARSRYYASFWAESIPILWLAMLIAII